ncbi:histidine--tRNA ligase [Priestia megaterium]|uniref:histidine--tRNA ligase n=1 Tax=Priestia megaterium TaxID=1404 RepID=UPI0030002D09
MSIMKNVKGTQDYLPSEQQVRNIIRETLEKTFRSYGFKPLETPIINYNELLSYKYGGGEEIVKEIYQLSDQGERELALRYDLTIPFSKVIGMNPEMRLPFKRYEIGKVFRDGPIKKGRLREFIQCDVDIVGIESVSAEAELMALAVDAFKDLNLDIYIQYNNRKLLTGLLAFVGISNEDLNSVILSLDKVEKVGIQGVLEELTEKNINLKHINRLRDLLSDKNIYDLSYIEEAYSNDLIKSGIKELEELQGYLESLNIKLHTTFNPFLARGLNIYTGTIYEVFLKNSTITSSIGSGGRYDEIIGKFLDSDRKYPTVGISFGLDVIFAALKENNHSLVQNNRFVDLLLIPLNTMNETLHLASLLRKNCNLKVEVDLTQKKLKKSMNYANKENIPYVIIVGEEELDTQILKLKDMNSGEEYDVSTKSIHDGSFSLTI